MKKRWVYQIDIFPHHDGVTITSRWELTGSLQKAIGEAMIAIDKVMLGEFYDVKQEIKAGRVTLIALGHREGYPTQPERVEVIITRGRLVA